MPLVDELIDHLGMARFITTLDLTKGYWQVPLSPASREKTTFATSEGLFQYTKLPFGLHGAPATFQRLMDRVLRPHNQYAVAYLDDIVIHSTDWESHLPPSTCWMLFVQLDSQQIPVQPIPSAGWPIVKPSTSDTR